MKKKLRSEFNSRQYMLARDFEVYYYSDLRFSSVGRHSHSYTEVYLFCEGEVDMEIGDRRFSERPYRRFVFWLSEDFCRALRAESPDFLYLFDRVQKKKEYVHPMDALEFNSLRSQLFTLLEELHTNRFGRDAQIGLYVRMLLLTLSRTVWQRENPRARKETRSSYQLITDYVAGHLDADLSLDTLSRELYLNKYHIAHLFQENTGLSLHQYITKKRLSACVDAMQSGKRISEICSQFFAFLTANQKIPCFDACRFFR